MRVISGLLSLSRQAWLLLTLSAFFLTPVLASAAGGWTHLRYPAPGPVQLMLLLPDGTVMAANPSVSNAWYKLTPDSSGDYGFGTWTTLAPMADTRLFYCSYVLPDGRVFIAGGEYGTGGAKAEIYDPQANTWTSVPVPTSLLDPTKPSPALRMGNQQFSDSGGVILRDGTILVAPVGPKTQGGTLIFNPGTNSWSAGPTYVRGVYQNEATWVKLPDDSILTVDPVGTNSERYIPSSNTWVDDGVVPVSLYGSVGGEIGAALLLANGRAFFMGGTGATAFYTSTGNTTKGSWTAGPTISNVLQYPLDNNGNQGTAFSTQGCPPDASAAMMVNGKILCAFSGQLYNDARIGTTPPGATNMFWLNAKNPQYPSPTSFFEYDPVANTYTQINSPTAPTTSNSTDNIPAYKSMMLDLPNGSVLYAHQGTDLYMYSPNDFPLAAGKPSIATLSGNRDGSYHLTGKLFNGISQGSSYGDDAQMDTNYPIVRLVAQNNAVTYARSFNWSSTSVQTGNKTVSTEFWLTGAPSSGGGGTYSLSVIANGIASDPVTFAGPVWVDFSFTGSPQQGTFALPYKTFAQGVSAISAGGTLVLKAPRTTTETITNLSKPMTIISVGGAATIGR
ncbi:MAG: kelch repeat-containing protein [Chthoniobacterales bacterium]